MLETDELQMVWRARKFRGLSKNGVPGLQRIYCLNSFRVLSRKLFKNELEAKWPKPDEFIDWDMWMRASFNRKERECIIPDISRTYHFGGKGLNVGGAMQALYFEKHTLNTEPHVKLDVEKMYKDNYEKEIENLLR